MRDPMAGKYKRDYKLEFEIARVVLDGEPGELAWGVHDYEAMTFASADVRLIFYPHKTSAGNYHLRIRDQASKDKERAQSLMDRLQIGSGHSCTFQTNRQHGGDFMRQSKLADQLGVEFGWARKVAFEHVYGNSRKKKTGA
ncbi:hypothetical protein DEE91_00885 [Ralstonia pickettii]|jgi:hypothetical protein|uniref:hypothetical protein n=1 Tax=Ralstonia TaxID=48736 RepID=UPI0006649DCC|nr:hypothetical protein [Ralstonia insidiosa]KMW48113.1 hypothetical protein AC240_07155 [Ralstonia sp. MD27]MBX3770293.1 hypothetical protein [Ralstonia pickettii]NOZ14821.1 hypothetical protein [Betaproteobacteria bacterium]MBA9854455.1 hypothetical protein [Ralstonia insidiosa]MBA9868270.1 hypothetical protein [Ralstonia insidiosa]